VTIAELELDMCLFLRIASIAGLLLFLLMTTVAIGLYWQYNFGDCKDGCGEGMSYIYFLPAVIAAFISAIIALVTHLLRKRIASI